MAHHSRCRLRACLPPTSSARSGQSRCWTSHAGGGSIATCWRGAGRWAATRSRALGAFHLDKLAEHGLLETSYRRLRHRRGPGAGRPAKLYRRSTRTLALALPARRYDLAAQILARAVVGGASSATRRAVGRAARATGRQLADAARPAPPSSAERRVGG